MPSQNEKVDNRGACPFMSETCPQGTLQGMQCQFRVAQDFDPVARFNDFQVVYCAVCRQNVTVLSDVVSSGTNSGSVEK